MKKLLTFVLCLSAAVFTLAPVLAQTELAPLGAGDSPVKVFLDAPNKTLVAGQPLVFNVRATNATDHEIQVYELRLQQTIEIELLKDGRAFRIGPIASMPAPITVTLEPGQSLQLREDVSSLLESHIDGGSYQMRARYDYGGEQVGFSNAIPLEVAPLTIQQKQELQVALTIIGGGEYERVVKAGREFLVLYPQSVFGNQVRLQTAFTLLQMAQNKQDQSIALSWQILASGEKRQWIRHQAQSYLWQAYADKGNVKAAIAMIEKIGGPQARDYIGFVKHLKGEKIFKPLPPDWDKAEPTGESINQMESK